MTTTPTCEKAHLPFKAIAGHPLSFLECEEEIVTPSGKKKIPFRIYEGVRTYQSILLLMKMYWDLEATVNKLQRERDAAREMYQAVAPKQEKMLHSLEIESRKEK